MPSPLGVPVISPVLAFSESPVGSTPLLTLQWYGVTPPSAAKVAPYNVPAVPTGNEGVNTRSDGSAANWLDTSISNCVGSEANALRSVSHFRLAFRQCDERCEVAAHVCFLLGADQPLIRRSVAMASSTARKPRRKPASPDDGCSLGAGNYPFRVLADSLFHFSLIHAGVIAAVSAEQNIDRRAAHFVRPRCGIRR